MGFRCSTFNLSRAGSSCRRMTFVLALIGIFGFFFLLVFSSSNSSSSSSFSPIVKRDVAAFENSTTEIERYRYPRALAATLDSRIDAEQLNEPPKKSLADEMLEQDEEQEAAFTFTLPQCPSISENSLLKGRVEQKSLRNDKLTEEEIAAAHAEIQPGGHWKPEHCQSRYKIAIIIPYRDRHSHLVRLLNFLYPILERQLLDFRFIVTEQAGNALFNKGRIMNAAFVFAEELGVDCVIFHDVDMFPQDDRVPYDCPGEQQPRHVGAYVSNLGYKLWYNELVGGVLAMTMDQYRSVNGYSNLYWGWGGEDDDMGMRLLSQNYLIERPNQAYARFSMLKHKKRKQVVPALVHKLLDTTKNRWKNDGVNQTEQWNVTNVEVKPLYYHLLVDVGKPPIEWLKNKK